MAKKGGNPAVRRAVPHPMLLALVAQFLENNGFNSSHRIYNTERRKRPKKEGWQGTFARNYTDKFPPLESIFNTWQQEHGKEDTTSNSETDSDASASEDELEPARASVLRQGKDEQDSASSSESASASTSDSESSDEEEQDEETAPKIQHKIATETTLGKSLKRKAVENSSDSDSTGSNDSSSESEEESGSDEKAPPVKKQRIESPPSSASESDSTSGSDSESDSESEADTPSADGALQEAVNVNLPSSSSDTSSESDDASGKEVMTAPRGLKKAGSDSSGTIVGDVKATQASPDTTSSDDDPRATKVVAAKKKHIGAQPTRLAQLSAAADLGGYVSNDYVSYDYADKAYRDLVVTRGKGFTKEKNKKKRGSYRGGAIDISGGKAFKFDD